MPARHLLMFMVLALPHAGSAGASQALAGEWRVARGVAAPWSSGVAASATDAWVGRTLQFGVARVEGPAPFPCDGAQYSALDQPPEGVFEGGLPAPAARAAANLGIPAGNVAGTRVSCSSGSFDFHHVDAETALFALDNVVWTLTRSPGALAAADAPEARVQRFLELHYAGEMGFLPASVVAKRGFISAALAARIDDYFAQPFPEDEPPPINGDPFTDSQEYPTRFRVGAARAVDGGVEVDVRFADAYVERPVVFVLVPGADGWRIDDLRYARGSRLSEDLAAQPEG